MTQLLLEAAGPSSSTLCVLGAGPCNDLDLRQLIPVYQQIHLVDLDGAAMWQGATQQGVASTGSIQLHGDCDVTGVAEALAGFKRHVAPPAQAVEAVLQSAAAFQLDQVPGPFDVVASVCLLSQLIENLVNCLGEDHPLFLRAMETIRRRHLELLIEKCRPGGTGILIFDFVSDVTVPGLDSYSADDLRRVLSEAIHARNFFHGMNPLRLNELFLKDPQLSQKVEEYQAVYPWVWNALEKQYAVTAVQFQRRA